MVTRIIEKSKNPKMKTISEVQARNQRHQFAFEAGFDLTEFRIGEFDAFLVATGVSRLPLRMKRVVKRDFIDPSTGKKYHRVYYSYRWSGDGFIVDTEHNPISGKVNANNRVEPDFAGYIGISASDPVTLLKVYNAVKKHALFIKDENPTQRDFI